MDSKLRKQNYYNVLDEIYSHTNLGNLCCEFLKLCMCIISVKIFIRLRNLTSLLAIISCTNKPCEHFHYAVFMSKDRALTRSALYGFQFREQPTNQNAHSVQKLL